MAKHNNNSTALKWQTDEKLSFALTGLVCTRAQQLLRWATVWPK